MRHGVGIAASLSQPIIKYTWSWNIRQ